LPACGETNINPVDHGKWHDLEFYAGDTEVHSPRYFDVWPALVFLA